MNTPTTSSPAETDVLAGTGTQTEPLTSSTPGGEAPWTDKSADAAETSEAREVADDTFADAPAQTATFAATPRPTLDEGPTVTYAGPQQPAPPKGPRLRSIAWGLVIALLGAVVILVGLGVRLDLQLVFIGILAVAGLTLLIGSLTSGSRKR